MHDWVREAARRRPDHVAVEAPDGAHTYAQLDAAVDRCARRLAALGVGEGDRVATTLPPSRSVCELLHALPRVGAALVPLSTRLPEPEQRRQGELAGALLTVAEPLDGLEARVAPRTTLDPAAVHSVLFTSGTGGAAKAVALTISNQAAAAAASEAALGSDPGDRWLCPLPLFHIGGLAILVRCARAGTTAVLHERFSAVAVGATLEAGEATLASLVPTMLARLRSAGLRSAPALRALLLGGGPSPPYLLDWARDRRIPVRCTYGMTETCSQVAVADACEPAGRPVPGAEIEIGPGEEIIVRGPMVAAARADAEGWIATGDRGHFDPQGRLHVEGRIDDLILTGGEKVSPAGVEAVLLAHPALKDAAVAGTASAEWGEEVTAYVVERAPVSDYDLLSFCREHLAGYQVPKRIERVERLPRNAAGKLLRAALGATE
ncbi:MAG: AMP-binding protein [Thermoleophilaceae bacterium]